MKIKDFLLASLVVGLSASVAMANATFRNLDANVRDMYEYTGAGAFARPANPFRAEPNVSIVDSKGNVAVATASRHHTIPWRTMLHIWDRVFFPTDTNGITQTYCAEAISILSSRLKPGRNGYTFYTEVTAADGTTVQLPTLFNNPAEVADLQIVQGLLLDAVSRYDEITVTPAQVDAFIGLRDVLQAALAWLPGNLFVGPDGSVRSDDPGESLEPNVRNVLNIGNREISNLYKLLSDADEDTNILNYDPKALGMQADGLVLNQKWITTELCQTVVKLVKPKDYQPYKPGYWECKPYRPAAGAPAVMKWNIIKN